MSDTYNEGQRLEGQGSDDEEVLEEEPGDVDINWSDSSLSDVETLGCPDGVSSLVKFEKTKQR